MPRASKRPWVPVYDGPSKLPPGASFQIGDRVVVYGRDRWGKPIIEGRGVVIGAGHRKDGYLVRYDGDDRPLAHYCIVRPGISQTKPATYLAMLRAQHKLGMAGR
jgi:hypothetical protein